MFCCRHPALSKIVFGLWIFTQTEFFSLEYELYHLAEKKNKNPLPQICERYLIFFKLTLILLRLWALVPKQDQRKTHLGQDAWSFLMKSRCNSRMSGLVMPHGCRFGPRRGGGTPTKESQLYIGCL